jgi:predicted GIY-YIG superfamily endonuclease
MDSFKTDYLIYAIFLGSLELQLLFEYEYPQFIYTENEHKRLYIGVTNNFDKRMWTHNDNTENVNYTSSKKLYNCIRKYGFENFTKIIIQTELTREESREVQQP